MTNSITSPNALRPRCACGLPANHRSRPHSKERASDLDNGFARLNLGPAVTSQQQHYPLFPHPQATDKRIVSDSTIHGYNPNGITIDRRAASGYNSPLLGQTGGSLLSRSRSDPIAAQSEDDPTWCDCAYDSGPPAIEYHAIASCFSGRRGTGNADVLAHVAHDIRASDARPAPSEQRSDLPD